MSSAPQLTTDSPQNRRGAVFRLLGTALGPVLGLILVFILFSVGDAIQASGEGRDSTFASFATVQKILRDSSQVGVAALGMTLIIIAGGIDLSAGTAMALCSTVTAWFFKEQFSPFMAVGLGVLTGCLVGLVNSTLISSLRVVPFIVTLGTMTIAQGIGLIVAKNSKIDAYESAPQWLIDSQALYPQPKWLLVSSGVWLMFFLAVVVAGILHYTVFGRHVFALGSNEATARLCGINVTRTRIAVYTLAGLFVGLAGMLGFAILQGEGDPKSGLGRELEVIAAVVIGGGSLSGGRGSVLGTLSGACIMATILHGCPTLGISTTYKDIIVGVIIIAAVALDQVRQRKLEG